MAFDNNKLGELRPNQIITTFGPGSIVGCRERLCDRAGYELLEREREENHRRQAGILPWS